MSTSSSGSTNHNKRQSLETDNSQIVLDNDSAQHLKLRERQRFFEEVYQHDMDILLSSAHLHIDSRKPPMGSISSMEVNVDMLEQMDLMDISDQEALDVFLNSGANNSPLASPLPEVDDEEEDEEDESKEVVYRERVPTCDIRRGSKSRMSSTSSGSSDTSGGGTDTHVVQSDDEEVHADTLLLTSVPRTKDEEAEEEDGEVRPVRSIVIETQATCCSDCCQ